jgi:hypothetical protein
MVVVSEIVYVLVVSESENKNVNVSDDCVFWVVSESEKNVYFFRVAQVVI